MKGGNQGTKAGGASTTTGGKPNNANNKNNNNTQKTRIQNHIPAKVISAHQIYEAYVHEVIISGGYLDASQMYLALHDQVNLDRMEEYRNLCTLNKRVENAIYGYWQSCEIHIFDKLEKFVTVAVSRWKKLSPVPDNFEALGLGDLVRCPKVIELFQFPSNINRSRFSKATPLDLIRKVADMLTKLKFHKFDDISEHLTSIEVNNFRQQNICSFQMDAKTCFYICHNMKPNKLELVDIQKKVKEEYLVKKKEEFRNAITDVLVNDVARLNPTTMNEEYKSYVNDETEVENRNFMKIANSFVPFPTMFRKFYQTAFFEEESIRSTFDFDDALFLHQLSIIQKKDQNKDIIFKTEEICHVLIKVVAVWIHHFSSWKRSKEGQQSTNPIFAILQDKYLADIPAECLDRMVKWLQYVAEFCDDLEFTEDGVKKLPTSSVLDSIEVQIDEILTVSIEDENTFIDPKERTALHNQLKAAGLWSPELKNFKFTIDCPLCNKSTESIPQHFEQCHPNVMRKDFEAIIRYTYIEITEKRRKIYNGDYVELIEEICRETKAKRIPEKISDGLMTCPWCKASVVIESQSLVTHCKSSHPQVQSSVVDTVSKYGLWAIKRIDEATGKFDSMIYTVGDQIGIRITDLEPLITSAIVFYRKTILDKYCVNDQNIDIVLDNLFQRFPCIEQDVDTDNSMVPIMRTLCGIEKELKTELNIPAFECQGVGSFLSLISVPSRMKKLKTILEPFIGVKKESEEEFMKNNVVVATELSEQETNQMSQIIFEQLSALIDSLQSSSVDITLIAALAYLHNTVKSYLQQLTGKYISFLDHLPALLQPQSDLEVLFDRFLSFFQMNATDDVQHTEEKEETTATRQAMSLVSEVEILQNLSLCKMIAISELCNPKKLLVEDTDCSQQDKLFIHTAEAITSRVSSLPLEVVFAIIEMVIKNLKYDETIAGYTSPSSLVQPNLPKYLSLASKMNVQNSCLYQSIKAKYTQFLSGKYNVILPTQEVTSRVLVPSCIQEAVNALNSTAFGKRCMEWTMWNEYFANKVCGDGLYCSIPEFLLLLNADNYFPNSTFKVLQDNTFDCVRLPIVTPDNKQIVNLWHRNHYDLLAAYCISAREYPNFVNQSEQKILSIWKGTFGMYMRSCLLELYESKGEYALQDLLLSVVHICYCIHRIENSVDVFQEFLYSLMDLAKVNASTIERCAWDACRESDVGRVYLSTLAANYSTRFSMLFTYGGEFAKNRQEVNIDLYQNVHTDNNQQSKSLSTAKEIANDLESNKICVANSNSDSLDNCEDIAESISNILTSTEGKCKQEVMELLQREFHYDQKGQRPSIETPEVRKLRNSLDLLAVSLYSSDVHFVMEVLQNADDNAYDEGIIPTLKFELFPHALVIFNNEKGFDVSNINAICNVGGSTKKGRVGYIGQKGIGFKSVFAISDRPEVHSNGYHIMFDKAISMLEPIWMDENNTEKWPVKIDPSDQTYYETCLRLMLNGSVKKSIHKLTQDLEEIFDGKLILFLNKVHRMIFEDKLRQARIEHDRVKINPYWTKIVSSYQNVHQKTNHDSSEVQTLWWTIRVEMENPPIRRMDTAIEHTEVIIAFPFTATSETTLELSFENGLFPVYAYLPTLTLCFPFMIQADFVLATSRESISENDWNRMLLNMVPSAFVGAIQELTNWMKVKGNMSSTEECHRLASLEGSYSLQISPRDIFKLIPRKSLLSKQFHPMTEQIFNELKSVPFLMNASGELCAASQVVSTGHLHFDPQIFISHEVIFQTLGKHFLHDSYNTQLDEELMDILGIERFSTKHIMQCIAAFAQLYTRELTSRTDSSNIIQIGMLHEASSPQYLDILSGLLLAWNEMNINHSPNGNSNSNVKKSAPITQLIPTHVRLKQNTVSASSGVGTSMHREAISVLKSLPIWPLSNGYLISLEKQIVLIQDTNDNMNVNQAKCLKEFEEDLFVLDAKLFSAADAAEKSFKEANVRGGGKLNVKRSDVLRSFLKNFFLPPSSVALEVSGHMIATGGIQMQSAEVIASSTILPAYRNWGKSDTNSSLTREKAAAYLAYLYLSQGQIGTTTTTALKETGMILPVMSARDRNKLEWSYDGLVHLGGKDVESVATQREVHLGVESNDSTTTLISDSNTMSTALRQLRWTVLDPLVSAFAAGAKNAKCYQKATNLTSVDIQRDFVNHNIPNEWKKFLLQNVGVVDFFKILPMTASRPDQKSQIQTNEQTEPHPNTEEIDQDAEKTHISSLLKLLKHLLRNGHVVSTSKITSPGTAFYLPMFLPNRDDVWASKDNQNHVPDNLLLVSEDVYKSLIKLIPRILKQFEALFSNKGYAQDPFCSTIMQELNTLMWFPIEVHKQLFKQLEPINTSVRHLNYSNMCLLASPPNIFFEKDAHDACKYAMGPHITYCPIYKFKADEILMIKRLVCLREVSKINDLPTKLIVSYWKWLASEDISQATILSNVLFMKLIYERVFDCLEDANKADPIIKETVHSLLTRDCETSSPTTSIAEEGGSDTNTKEKKVVWIPDQYPILQDKNEDRNTFYEGQMYALADLSKEDRADFLVMDGPIKNLSKYYFDHASDVLTLFTRKKYCTSCKASEGLFGVLGKSKAGTASYTNPCRCEYKGSFAHLFPTLVGPICESPTIAQLLQQLTYHRERLSIQTHETKHLQQFYKILSSISNNIWKCFHIQMALHPYSAAQLKDLIEVLRVKALIPIVGSKNEFVTSIPPTGKYFLAVDDVAVYDCFKPIFMKKAERYIFIDAGVSVEDTAKGVASIIHMFFNAERLDNLQSITYDVENLQADSEALLNLPPIQFSDRARFIPPLTFFAPKHLLSLWKLINIPALSEWVTVEMHKEVNPLVKKGEQSASKQLMMLLNALLELCQCFLLKYFESLQQQDKCVGGDAILKTMYNLTEYLMKTKRMQRLLNSKMYNCIVLQRKLKLQLGSRSYDGVLEDVVQLALQSNEPSPNNTSETPVSYYEVFLKEGIKSDELQEIGVDLILQVIRTEIAVMASNQQVDLMMKMEECLRKFAKVSASEWSGYMKFEGLDKYLEQCKEKPWLLADPLTEEEEVTVEVTLEVTATDTAKQIEVVKVAEPEEEIEVVTEEEKARREAGYLAYKLRMEETKEFNNKVRKEREEQQMLQTKIKKEQEQQKTTKDASHNPVVPPKAPVAIQHKVDEIEGKRLAQATLQRLQVTEDTVIIQPEDIVLEDNGEKSPFIIVEYNQDATTANAHKKKKPPLDSLLGENVVERILVESKEVQLASTADTVQDQQRRVMFETSNQTTDKASTPQVIYHWKAKHLFQDKSIRDESTERNSNSLHMYDIIDRVQGAHHPTQGLGSGSGLGSGQGPSGNGRWHGDLPTSREASNNTIYNINLPVDVVQSVLDNVVNADASYQQLKLDNDSLQNQIFPDIGSWRSGRIGELLAVNCLKLKYPADVGICWENEMSEAGLPYDIVLIDKEGKKKFVEVKTRSSTTTASVSNLWRISSAEVHFAHQMKADYFCILISLIFHDRQGEVEIVQMNTVGEDIGLVQCLHEEKSCLLLKVAEKAITSSGEDIIDSEF